MIEKADKDFSINLNSKDFFNPLINSLKEINEENSRNDFISEAEKAYEAMAREHNGYIVTFMWFLITTNWVLIASSTAPSFIKILLLTGTILIIFWLLNYITYSQECRWRFNKFQRICSEYRYNKDWNHKKEEMDKLLFEPTNLETRAKNIYENCKNIWIWVSIIWLFMFLLFFVIRDLFIWFML